MVAVITPGARRSDRDLTTYAFQPAMPVIECDVGRAQTILAAAGAEIREGNTDHERWRARRGDASAVAYDGKVVVQGNAPQDIVAILRRELENGPNADRAHLYFDGAARGNPGPAGIGWVIVTADGIVAEGSDRIGRSTNNQAEYDALIAVLKAARDYGFRDVQIRGDSELVIKQVRGEYDTNDPDLRERRVTVRELLESFDEWSIQHVPRETNERADSLANQALDEQ